MLWSKTFKISNKMLLILSLLAVAAIWFGKFTSLPKIFTSTWLHFTSPTFYSTLSSFRHQ